MSALQLTNPEFYSQVRSRAFVPQCDDAGKITAMTWIAYASLPKDYAFRDLHAAYTVHLDATVQMLDLLATAPSVHL